MKTKKKSRFNPVAKHAAKYNKAAVFVPKKLKKEKHSPTKKELVEMYST